MTARSAAPFPPPPDIEPETGDGPIRFVAQLLDREIAALGDNQVGAIEPVMWSSIRMWAYRTSLFGGALQSRADSKIKARVALLHRIADWHDLAGPAYAPLAKQIRAQADGMR